jgi:hypothetical protein
MKERASSLRAVAANERGGIGIIILVIVFIAILLTPIFLDLAVVYYGRRVAQTGADAAALAAAKEYADELSGRWEGECGDSPDEVREDYRDEVIDVAWGGIGYAWAWDYALANRVQLVSYSGYPYFDEPERVSGGSLPHIYVDTKVEKPLDLWLDELYGRSFSSPAQARAKVYFSHSERRPEVCWIEGVRDTRYIFTFSWGIRLVK